MEDQSARRLETRGALYIGRAEGSEEDGEEVEVW